eukprot:TRINITY_DN9248_c0_g1_i1.p1 TRINITY_DN9248_c0_g1~~TRINITY_DN9248_c0_g1_i1.p1  ORF type:complete len:460 (-),score=63.57 TRINITY_DN9248_c0_g1_i1:149-1495(-)
MALSRAAAVRGRTAAGKAAVLPKSSFNRRQQHQSCLRGSSCLSQLRPQLRRCAGNATSSINSSSNGSQRSIQLTKERLDELLKAEMKYVATMPVRPVSMTETLSILEPDRISAFIQTEVPKRFAFRVRMVETLAGWESIPELVEVHAMMQRWYRELRLIERSCEVGLRNFTACTRAIRQDGNNTVALVAVGIHKLQSHKAGMYTHDFLDRWLDGFLLSRIGSNMLLDQYFACASKQDGGLERPTGIIHLDCDAVAICKKAADYASRICQAHTGHQPFIVVENYEAGKKGPQADSPCYFSYIPGYLRYIMIEVLKNSFQATLRTKPDEILAKSPIHVLVCRDEYRVVIRVSDRGGGIPFEVGDRIWSYLYGAAARDQVQDPVEPAQALSGYGVGLPLSRLHARYLGGQLEVTSYPGYGTDVTVMLPRLDKEMVEKVNIDDVTGPGLDRR